MRRLLLLLLAEPSDKIKRIYIMKDFLEPGTVCRPPALNFFQGTYYTETLFEKLVARSLGVERLGVLRMDVDFRYKSFPAASLNLPLHG